MDIAVGERFVGLVAHIVVGATLKNPYQFLAIAAYHFAVTPSYSSRQQSYNFYILLALKASWKLHRVIVDKLRGIDASRLAIQQILYVVEILIFHIVKLIKYWE